MRRLVLLILALLLLPTPAAAKSDRSLILGFLRAVHKGEDLRLVYPGAISKGDAEKLHNHAECPPDNPITLKKGEYWIIFQCSLDKRIAAQVNISDGKIFNVWTYAVESAWEKRWR